MLFKSCVDEISVKVLPVSNFLFIIYTCESKKQIGYFQNTEVKQA